MAVDIDKRAGRPPESQHGWDHPCLILYHGTTVEAAQSVAEHVKRSLCARRTDFGQGSYLTTYERQAERWARLTAQRRRREGAEPAVVRFEVCRDELCNLAALAFVRYGKTADDFWALVAHCREGNDHRRPRRHAGDDGWYDRVCGLVASNWERREAYRTYDQISFHTDAGVEVLERKPREWYPV